VLSVSLVGLPAGAPAQSVVAPRAPGQRGFGVHELSLDGAVTDPRRHGAPRRRRLRLDARELVPNLPGTQAFRRFDSEGTQCLTALNGLTLTAADHSLQLASTVTRALSTTQQSFNPCTWDDANPPSAGPLPPDPSRMAPGDKPVRIFPRDAKKNE